MSIAFLFTQINLAQNQTSSERPIFNISQLSSDPIIDDDVLND